MDNKYLREIENIRKKLRRYSRNSIIVNEINRLGAKADTQHEEVRKAPWLSFLLIELVFSVKEYTNSRTISEKEHLAILNELWHLQGAALDVERPGFRLAFRGFMATQYLCQRDLGYALRNLKRINILFEINGRLEKQKGVFAEETKISIDRFTEFVFILLISFGFIKRLIKYEELIHILYPYFSVEEIIISSKLLSATAGQLQGLVKSEEKYVLSKERYSSASILIDKPIIRTEQGLLIIHGSILDVGLSEIITTLFNRRFGSEFKDKLGKALEDYTAELCKSTYKVTTEDELRVIYRDNNLKDRKVTDFIVMEDDKRIFIEVKATDPGRDIPGARTQERMTQRLKKKLLKGVIQATECNQTLNDIGDKKDEKDCYVIIITYKDFYISTGADIQTYTGEGFFTALSQKYNDIIPTDNIHYMSIEDFECLCLLSQEHSVKISDFLGFCTKTMRNDGVSFDMRMYLNKYYQESGFGDVAPFGVDLLQPNNNEPFSETIKNLEASKIYWENRGQPGAKEFYQIFNIMKRALLR